MPFYPKLYESFYGTNVPTENPADTNPVTLAHRFIFAVDCYLIGARYYRDLADDAEHMAIARDGISGAILRVALFHVKAATGSGRDDWQTCYFAKRLELHAGDLVDLSIWFGRGNYWRTLDALPATDTPNASGHIVVQGDDPTLHPNGRYSYSADLFPNLSFSSSGYGIDPVIWIEGT